MNTTARRRTPWPTIIGLALLWAAFLAVAYFSVLLTLWGAATAALTPLEVVLGVAPLLLVLTVLICTTLWQRWARWTAVVLLALPASGAWFGSNSNGRLMTPAAAQAH